MVKICGWRCALVFWLLVPLQADDFAPPWWRGERISNSDVWEFGEPNRAEADQSSGIPPGRVRPPEIQGGTRWENLFTGRKGVWRLDSQNRSELRFTIPNIPDVTASKWLLVQLTYWQTGEGPTITVLDDAGNTLENPHKPPAEDAPDGNGWKHLRSGWVSINRCPSFEEVIIRPSSNGVAYIDEVIIDSKCENAYAPRTNQPSPGGSPSPSEPPRTNNPGTQPPQREPGGNDQNEEDRAARMSLFVGLSSGIVLTLLALFLYRKFR